MSLDLLGMFELREDHLGKDFSKFDAHLVCGTVVIRWCPVGGREETRTERVEFPDHAVHEYLELVQCDQCAYKTR
jgi:hypothetical protein